MVLDVCLGHRRRMSQAGYPDKTATSLRDKPLTPAEMRGTVPASLLQRFCKHMSAVLAPEAQHQLLKKMPKRKTWNHKQLLHLCSQLR